VPKQTIKVPCKGKGDKIIMVEVEGDVLRYKVGFRERRFLIHPASQHSKRYRLSHIATGMKVQDLVPPHVRLNNPWKPRELAVYYLDKIIEEYGADVVNERIDAAPLVNT